MELLEAFSLYAAAWDESDASRRRQLLGKSWSDAGIYVDADNPDGLVGHDALLDYIVSVRQEMPGLAIVTTSVRELGGRLWATWTARQGDREAFVGTDFVEFAADGRIGHLTNFYDEIPEG